MSDPTTRIKPDRIFPMLTCAVRFTGPRITQTHLYAALLLAMVILACGGPTRDGAPETPSRPNFLFLYTDDQAAWALSREGESDAHTPNLDLLFSEGARFTNSFTTTPVCSPSRAGLMTSRYGSELGITDFLSHSQEPDLGLDPETVTWAEVLQSAGYATGLIGEWRLGEKDRYHPTRAGFDFFAGWRTGGNISKDPELEVDGKLRRIEGYTPDILTDFAIDFMRERREGPFSLSVHFWAPHANISNRTPDGDRTWLPLSEADWGRFRDLDVGIPNPNYPKLDIPRLRRMTREYLGSVASVDRNVGRLMAALDKLGLRDNTVVIFTSDHGFNMGHNGIWHKGNGRWILTDRRGYRANLYDRSLRVPAAVRWPGVVAPGTVIEETATNLDWYPTLLKMAGLALPEGVVVRGRDLTPLLKGGHPEWDNDLFAEYKQYHFEQADQYGYRTPEWKLVRDFSNPEKDELYHLTEDPDERRNLIDSQDPKVTAAGNRLQVKLEESHRSLGL